MSEPRAYSVTPTPRSDGADLAPSSAHYEDFLKDMVGVLRDQPELWERFVDLIEGEKPAHDRHLPDVPSRDDRLAKDIVSELPDASTSIRLHGPEVDRLAGALSAISRSQGGRPYGVIPAQQDRRAS